MKKKTRFALVTLATILPFLGWGNQALAGSLSLNATSFGNYSTNGTRSTSSYLTGKNSTSGTNDTNRSFFVFNIPAEMSAPYRTILSSQILLSNPAGGYLGPSGSSRTLNITQVTTANIATAGNSTAIFNDLGATGPGNVIYGGTTVSAANNNSLVMIDLNGLANADIVAAAGSSFGVGGALTGLSGTSRQVLFSGSNSSSTKQLKIDFADAQAQINDSQQFGNVLVGQSRSLDLTVTNSGDMGSKLSGSIGTSDNPAIAPTSGPEFFTALAQGESVTRSFTFTPTERSRGTATQTTIVIDSNTKNAIPNPLFTGFGVAPENALTVRKDNMSYVRIGTQADLGIILQNVGDGNLSGAGDISNLNGTVSLTGTGEFSGINNSLGNFSLRDNVAKAIDLLYTPTDHGEDQGVITLDFLNGRDDGTNLAQQKTVTISGYGVGPQFQSSIAPGSSIDFGNVYTGAIALLPLVITNSSSDPTDDPFLTGLTLIDAYFDGLGSEAFSLLNFTPGTVLLPGQSLELQLQFTSSIPQDFSDIVLNFLTDQGTSFGRSGELFSFNVRASAIPEPTGASALLALAGLWGILTKKPKGTNPD